MFLRNVCHNGLEGTASFFHLHKNILAHTFVPAPSHVGCCISTCRVPAISTRLVSQNPEDSTRTTARQEPGVVMGGALCMVVILPLGSTVEMLRLDEQHSGERNQEIFAPSGSSRKIHPSDVLLFVIQCTVCGLQYLCACIRFVEFKAFAFAFTMHAPSQPL